MCGYVALENGALKAAIQELACDIRAERERGDRLQEYHRANYGYEALSERWVKCIAASGSLLEVSVKGPSWTPFHLLKWAFPQFMNGNKPRAAFTTQVKDGLNAVLRSVGLRLETTRN